MRPANWIKNLLVSFPVLLSGQFNAVAIGKAGLGFLCFSLLSSSVYILNDIRDIENDRMHHMKWRRPLASAEIPVEKGFVLAAALACVTFVVNAFFAPGSLSILLVYFLLNYLYSSAGKRMRFIDILLLSSFYILRVIYGGEITGVPLTGWFMATITMAVLAVSVHKRYMECRFSVHEQIPGRGYRKEDEILLRQLMFNFSMLVQVLLNIHAYFVLKIGSAYFYCLLNLVVAGIFFFYFDDSKNRSEDPVERILRDKRLLALLLFFFILYTYEVIIRNR